MKMPRLLATAVAVIMFGGSRPAANGADAPRADGLILTAYLADTHAFFKQMDVFLAGGTMPPVESNRSSRAWSEGHMPSFLRRAVDDAAHGSGHLYVMQGRSTDAGAPSLQYAFAIRTVQPEHALLAMVRAEPLLREMEPNTYAYRDAQRRSWILHAGARHLVLASSIPTARRARALVEAVPEADPSPETQGDATARLDMVLLRKYLEQRLAAMPIRAPGAAAASAQTIFVAEPVLKAMGYYLLQRSALADVKALHWRAHPTLQALEFSCDVESIANTALARAIDAYARRPAKPLPQPIFFPQAAYNLALRHDPEALAEYHRFIRDDLRVLTAVLDRKAATSLAESLQQLMALEHGYRSICILPDRTQWDYHVLHAVHVEDAVAYERLFGASMAAADKLTGQLQALAKTTAPHTGTFRILYEQNAGRMASVPYARLQLQVNRTPNASPDTRQVEERIQVAFNDEAQITAVVDDYFLILRGPRGEQLLSNVVVRLADDTRQSAAPHFPASADAPGVVGITSLRVLDCLKLAARRWAKFDPQSTSAMVDGLVQMLPTSDTPIDSVIWVAQDGPRPVLRLHCVVPVSAWQECLKGFQRLPFAFEWNVVQ